MRDRTSESGAALQTCQKPAYYLRGAHLAGGPQSFRTRIRPGGTSNFVGPNRKSVVADYASCAQCMRYRSAALLGRQPPGRCSDCGCSLTRESVALALIEHRKRLVLIKRTKAPLAGYWAPPAGHVEMGETVPQAVIREAREESGLEITLDGMVGIYTEQRLLGADSHMVITAFNSHSVNGDPVAGDDAGDIALFARGKLPQQPPPRQGTATDYWVYGVIQRLTANWR